VRIPDACCVVFVCKTRTEKGFQVSIEEVCNVSEYDGWVMRHDARFTARLQ